MCIILGVEGKTIFNKYFCEFFLLEWLSMQEKKWKAESRNTCFANNCENAKEIYRLAMDFISCKNIFSWDRSLSQKTCINLLVVFETTKKFLSMAIQTLMAIVSTLTKLDSWLNCSYVNLNEYKWYTRNHRVAMWKCTKAVLRCWDKLSNDNLFSIKIFLCLKDINLTFAPCWALLSIIW